MADQKRPIGRPPLSDSPKPPRVHVTMRPEDFDRAESIAKRQNTSVPELMRRGLSRVFEDEADDDV